MIVTISSNLEKALWGIPSSAVNPQLSAALSTLVLVQICKALAPSLYTDPLSFDVGESCGGHSRILSGCQERAACGVTLWTASAAAAWSPQCCDSCSPLRD